MDSLIQLIILISAFIFGFNYATFYVPVYLQRPGEAVETLPQEKEILWFIRYYGRKYLPVYIQKPLFSCEMCMSSIWGSLFYWTYILNGNLCHINSLTLIKWAVVVIAVCGLNRIIKQLAHL